MAKNIGVVQYSGTLGNTVGAKKSAGQKANTIRIKPTSTKVSYTGTLIAQRMKMRAITNLYSGLKGILDHAFQGVAYGAPSHNHFSRLALSKANSLNPDNKFPVFKGENRPIPFPVTIASGSAPAVMFGMTDADSAQHPNAAYISVGSTAVIAETSLLAMLQAVNPEIQKGDQLTLIASMLFGNGVQSATSITDRTGLYSIRYDIRRLVLDKGDDDKLIADYDELEGLTFAVDNGKLFVTYPNGVQIAFAVILSRPSTTANEENIQWERSNTNLVVLDEMLIALNDEENVKAAMDSYRKSSANAESPWYLNQGELNN